METLVELTKLAHGILTEELEAVTKNKLIIKIDVHDVPLHFFEGTTYELQTIESVARGQKYNFKTFETKWVTFYSEAFNITQLNGQ